MGLCPLYHRLIGRSFAEPANAHIRIRECAVSGGRVIPL
jgi:hypothetical protein